MPVITQALYVPGEPGADWSEEEILIVKAKLIRIVSNGASAYDALNPGHSWNWRRMPTAAKFLRLGFHDCLKYVYLLFCDTSLKSCAILGTLMALVAVMVVLMKKECG